MRALPICLVVLMLNDCSMLNRPPVEPTQSTTPQPKAEPVEPEAPRTTPVRIYANVEELVGKPFRDPGEASGDSCQAPNQDSSPSIPTVRKRIQISASRTKINAALLCSYEVTSGMPGCYHQTICIDSAPNITVK